MGAERHNAVDFGLCRLFHRLVDHPVRGPAHWTAAIGWSMACGGDSSRRTMPCTTSSRCTGCTARLPRSGIAEDDVHAGVLRVRPADGAFDFVKRFLHLVDRARHSAHDWAKRDGVTELPLEPEALGLASPFVLGAALTGGAATSGSGIPVTTGGFLSSCVPATSFGLGAGGLTRGTLGAAAAGGAVAAG